MSRIMVIDDSIDTQQLLRLILTSEGHECFTANDGLEAWEELHTNSPLPHLLILDLMMPRMNGWEFLRKKSLSPILQKIPIVLFSAANSAQDFEVEYLAKPVSVERLLSVVEKYCPKEVLVEKKD